ncbi:MAG: hypothetical protein EBU08_06475 [Micrococcales bacterium]|nr:hypothetical protein [Micrococcales bacterium]
MSVTKRIGTGDYNLTTVAPAANVIVTTDTLKIYGNLYVQGNTSVVNVANISTADPTITLDSNVSSPFSGNSGIEIYRGPGYYIPALYWNETVQAWQITSNIRNPAGYANISTAGATTGSVNQGKQYQLAYYQTDGLVSNVGGNLTWTGNSLMTISGNLNATNITLGTANLTTGVVNSGGTGIYFNNSGTADELASKSAAIKYSIIFG